MTREEKIKGLYSLKEYLVENPIELEGHKSLPITLIDYAIEALEQEPKKGHWIDTNYHQYYNDGDIETTELRCSCCNEEVEWDIELLHKPYYCENCGSDNREVEK